MSFLLESHLGLVQGWACHSQESLVNWLMGQAVDAGLRATRGEGVGVNQGVHFIGLWVG